MTRVFLAHATSSPGRVAGHSKDFDGTQTLVVLWSSKPEIRRVSGVDLVLIGSNSDRSDLVKDQIIGGIA